MLVADYAATDAVGLAALVRDRMVTVEELVELACDAAERVDRSLNAVVELFDEPERHDPDGPLAGVPFLVKDLGRLVSGRRCEAGSRLLEGEVAERDTELMRRFRSSGLVAIGRAATSELALAATVETALRGPTRNPWDSSRSTGGSSGGSAAAVAAGVVPIAHGSDGGGSIRIPAACCGVVGFKPSRGRVSAEPAGLELGGLNVQFALSRSVRDAAVLLDAVHGPAVGDSALAPPPRGSFERAVSARPRLRIGVTTGHFWEREMDPEVTAAVLATARTCSRLGHRVEEVKFPPMGEGYRRATLDVWCTLVAAELDAAVRATGRPASPETLEGHTLAWYEHGRRLSAPDVVRALDTLHEASRSVNGFFEELDVLLSATLPTLPPPLGEWQPERAVTAGWYYDESSIGNLESTTSAFNCSGQPAVSLPLHESIRGLPIGIHLAARLGHEEELFAVAAELEQELPWSDRHPPTWAGGPG